MPRYIKVPAVKPLRRIAKQNLVDVEHTYVVPPDLPTWKLKAFVKVCKWLGVKTKQKQTLSESVMYDEIVIDPTLGNDSVRTQVQNLITEFYAMNDPVAVIIIGADLYHQFVKISVAELNSFGFDSEFPMTINNQMTLYGIRIVISERIEGLVPLTQSMLKAILNYSNATNNW